MKITVITAVLAALCISVANGQEKMIKSEITQITVFSEGAQISGTSSASLQPGTTDLVIGGLSPYIDPASIQVTGEGNFMILGVNLRNNYLENPIESKNVADIKLKIEALSSKIEDERTTIDVLKEKESFLKANYNVSAGKTTFTTEQMKAFLDLFTANTEAVKTSILKKTRSIKELEKEKLALENQLQTTMGKASLPTGEIVVSSNATGTATAKLKISYVVMQAGWYPSYDIRVDDIGGAASIIYKANIYQNTGIDWNDVKISLSSSSPMTAGSLPILYPWYINFYTERPRVMMRGVGSMKKSESMTAMDEVVMAEEAMPSAAIPVSITESSTSFSFDVNVNQTILCDGKPEVVELQRLTAPATYKYEAIPKNNTSAYLMGYLTDWNKYNLLPGTANIYFSNTFTGTGQINTAELTDTLPVSLGADKAITIKREKRVDYSSRKTIGLNVVETRSFLISVRNNKKQAVSLKLHDQLPISQSSNISVEATELTGGKQNDQTGEVIWELSVAPQETKNIVFTYSVKYPKNQKVILE